jgi:hypothetical protein
MYFLFIKVSNIDYYEDICLALQSAGISKASSFEATNLDVMLGDELPFLRGLLMGDEERDRKQTNITGLIYDKSQAADVIAILEESGIDLKNDSVLRLILLPVETVYCDGEWKGKK